MYALQCQLKLSEELSLMIFTISLRLESKQ